MLEDMLILEVREALVNGPPSLLVASEFALLAETVAAQSAILLGWWVKRSRESRVISLGNFGVVFVLNLKRFAHDLNLRSEKRHDERTDRSVCVRHERNGYLPGVKLHRIIRVGPKPTTRRVSTEVLGECLPFPLGGIDVVWLDKAPHLDVVGPVVFYLRFFAENFGIRNLKLNLVATLLLVAAVDGVTVEQETSRSGQVGNVDQPLAVGVVLHPTGDTVISESRSA
jgi:hypothetical protein